MSEPFSKHRGPSGGLDLRGREASAGTGEKLDPLAELARLVGREDPFRDLFPTRDTASKPARADRSETPRHAPTPEAFDRFTPAAAPLPPYGRAEDDGFGPREGESVEDLGEDNTFHSPLGQGRRASFRLPALPPDEALDAAGQDLGVPAEYRDAPELNADLWAQGVPEPVSSDPLRFVPPVEDADAAQGSSRRTLVVLLAVLALTVGGLGATFLVRNGAGSAGTSEPPTILADSGPTKVQPPDTSNQATGGDGNTALLEKSASDNVSNAKVVNTQEQPADLSQLPAAPAAAAAAPEPKINDGRVATTTGPVGSNASPFPEPRRVKTILIRPDGSVVGEDQAAAAGASAPAPTLAPSEPVLPTRSVGTTPVAKPSTPKSTVRATSTPKATATPSEGTAPIKPKVGRAPKPKLDAVQTATADTATDATASTTPPASMPTAASGSFAVQLAAPPTEQEAQDISSRLQKKFSSELDGRTPAIHKAEKGDKSVYRVRIGNLSQDDAKSLCGKLQAGGGSCFVVRN